MVALHGATQAHSWHADVRGWSGRCTPDALGSPPHVVGVKRQFPRNGAVTYLTLPRRF
jgi:hypothetical protein